MGCFPSVRLLDKSHSSSEPQFPHLSQDPQPCLRRFPEGLILGNGLHCTGQCLGRSCRTWAACWQEVSNPGLTQQKGMAGFCPKGPPTSRKDRLSKAPCEMGPRGYGRSCQSLTNLWVSAECWHMWETEPQVALPRATQLGGGKVWRTRTQLAWLQSHPLPSPRPFLSFIRLFSPAKGISREHI